jgi:hypothetical protein
MNAFELIPHTKIDKLITIKGPGIDIMIDYDDVDHKVVDKQVKLLMEILESYSGVFDMNARFDRKT